MTLRCALHARYSSDQQRAASIEDQFRICREHAQRRGWKMAGAYRDAAISGDSVILRSGIQGLLEDARRGLFEIVVAEALDRVSRDQADVAALYKHLRFAGVMIVTLSEGEINELHVGLKGTMNALFFRDLAAKIHRGLRGRVEAGKSGGGICYGYDVVKLHDAAVFSVGSIAWAGSLAHSGFENNVAKITGNVLTRFLDPEPFQVPPR